MAAIAWCTIIPGLQVYLFRRTFPDLWKNHMTGSGSFPELLAPWVKSREVRIIEGKNKIKFANGSQIHLCHCQYASDVIDYQGAEIHVLMIDELTQWTEDMYRYLRGRVRLGGLKVPDAMKGRFPRVLAGANPGGIGHNWVRSSFIKIGPPLSLNQMPDDQAGMLRQYIPARLEDNPTLTENDPDYVKRLSGLGSKELVQAMREGNWDIVAGGALDDVWGDGRRIIVPRFKLPASWRIDRSYDWGQSKPFSVLWFGMADGSEAKLENGNKFAPVRGSLIVAHEWYGAKGPNEGLMMQDSQIAKGIISREDDLMRAGWFPYRPKPGPADNMIDNVRMVGVPTIADEMKREGVVWEPSDKAPGTRKIGLALIRSRLQESQKDQPEAPCLYVMEHNAQALDHWPVLPRDKNDPDDVDTEAEDHDYDALRYRTLATKPGATVINIGMAH